LSAWKKSGDLIEIGQTSQRCICEIDNKGTIAAGRRAGDSRLPPDVESADIRSAFTVGHEEPLGHQHGPSAEERLRSLNGIAIGGSGGLSKAPTATLRSNGLFAFVAGRSRASG